MNEILKLREEIDNIDNKIFELFEKRFEIVKRIMSEKNKINLAIEDEERERKLIEKQMNNFKLNKEFINNLYKLIFNESKTLKC